MSAIIYFLSAILALLMVWFGEKNSKTKAETYDEFIQRVATAAVGIAIFILFHMMLSWAVPEFWLQLNSLYDCK